MDLTNDLYLFAAKNGILLIGNYQNVKKTTLVKFKCSNCLKDQEKKFKILLKQEALEPNICFECFEEKNIL